MGTPLRDWGYLKHPPKNSQEPLPVKSWIKEFNKREQKKKDRREFLQAVKWGLLFSVPLAIAIIVPFMVVLWIVVSGI